jgi:hypothetical protein
MAQPIRYADIRKGFWLRGACRLATIVSALPTVTDAPNVLTKAARNITTSTTEGEALHTLVS